MWKLRKLLSIDWWCEINVTALSFHFDFWGPFWWENGLGRHVGAYRIGASKPDQKVGTRWGPFGSLVISTPCSKTLWPLTPLLLHNKIVCAIFIRIHTRYYLIWTMNPNTNGTNNLNNSFFSNCHPLWNSIILEVINIPLTRFYNSSNL